MTDEIVLRSGTDLAEAPKLALEDVRAEMAALQAHELLVVNRDVQQLLSTGYGVLDRVATLRARAVAGLPDANFGLLDRFETYILALSWAQGLYLTAIEPDDGLDALIELGHKARATLTKDAAALAQRGLINGRALARLHGGRGRNALASDLGMLHAVLSQAWATIAGKCALTRDELDLASRIQTRMERLRGRRERAPKDVAAAVDVRRRAFTLFMRAYAEARVLAQCLNRKPYDPSLALPSLYARQKHRKAAHKAAEPAANTDRVTETAGGGD